MPASRRQTLALAGILAVGAWLRFWTVGDGLPYSVGVDEPVILEKVLVMLQTGDLNPHFFHYGGFVFNFHLAIAAVGYFAGALGRDIPSVDQIWAGDLYFWSRVATAGLATATIYLVYLAAKRWGQTVALVAALAMAVQPQLVREAHYALTDTPLMFFLALTLLLSIRAAESGGTGAFALAGLAAGLAAGTKYNGVVAGVMPVVAVLATVPASRWVGALAVAAGGTAAGFVVASPYALLDFRGFVDGFTDLATLLLQADVGPGESGPVSEARAGLVRVPRPAAAPRHLAGHHPHAGGPGGHRRRNPRARHASGLARGARLPARVLLDDREPVAVIWTIRTAVGARDLDCSWRRHRPRERMRAARSCRAPASRPFWFCWWRSSRRS